MGGGGDPGESAADSGVVVTVHIRSSNGAKFSVQTRLDLTVAAFKALIVGNCEVPVEQQRLIYKGRILKDEQTLESYGMQADHTIHLVRGAAPPASNNSTSSSPNARGPNSTQGLQSGLGSNEARAFVGAGTGGSLFPGLGSVNGLGGSGLSGLFGSGLPELEQVQQQLTQNPGIMREIMNMPAIQNLMNNPEVMRSFIMSNPQMREIIDRNPELGHVLNDPNTLRQTLEAARNPELMREMMRNTDRAMSNIESSPEGFNMLRRMYETVQEPFLNATTMAGDTGNDLGSNPFASLLEHNQAAGNQMLNPTTTGSETASGSPVPNSNPLPNPWSNLITTGSTQTNTGTRSINSSSDARAPDVGGLGRLALPELEQVLGGMQDSSLMSQVMQNPAMSQIMQSVLSNPQYMNQILDTNPQLRSMMASNSQLRDMMQNPEFIRQMTSPETIQQLLALQQPLLSQLGQQQSAQNQGPNGTGAGTANSMGLDFLMNMFGGLGAGGLTVPNQPEAPPEQLYATQLSQLQEMGFFDTQENIRALNATAGNVHAAVDRLLGNLNQ